MDDASLVSFREMDVPLDNIQKTIEEVVELYGGETTTLADHRVEFTLPARRGVSGATEFECSVRWEGPREGGTVELSADREIVPSKMRAVVLLGLGAGGAILAMMWPFFPQMGGLSGVGAILAIAVFLLTMKIRPGGIAVELLERIVDSQRELEGDGAGSQESGE